MSHVSLISPLAVVGFSSGWARWELSLRPEGTVSEKLKVNTIKCQQLLKWSIDEPLSLYSGLITSTWIAEISRAATAMLERQWEWNGILNIMASCTCFDTQAVSFGRILYVHAHLNRTAFFFFFFDGTSPKIECAYKHLVWKQNHIHSVSNSLPLIQNPELPKHRLDKMAADNCRNVFALVRFVLTCVHRIYNKLCASGDTPLL